MVAAREPLRHLNDDACWQAVIQRRSASDGLFVTAVRTTKVYCRPSCPSRTPLRRNVRFFATPAEAEAVGFRPCRRCRPRDVARPDLALVREVCRALDAAGDDAPTLAELGARFGRSPFHLQRTFKRIVGVTPRQYAEARRMQRVRRSLRESADVTTAIYDAGLGSSSRLYERAGARLGMTPASYRRYGAGAAIAYTITSCEFGRMLVAATDRGVAHVAFAVADHDLERDLHREFAAAEIRRDDAGLRPAVDAVVAGIAGREPSHPVPLDVRATAFRIRVWEALRRIPRGETRSYSDIAREVGSPRAARAVGTACKENPVPIIVPCHRVVREDGTLGGYALGLDRKRALLARERQAAAAKPARNGRASRPAASAPGNGRAQRPASAR